MALAEAFEFRGEDPSRLVEVMERIAAERNGWVNLLAGIRPEDAPPPTSAIGAIFGAESAAAPFCTWVPGRPRRRGGGGLEHDKVGIQHASGPRALSRLEDAGLRLPEGWRLVQDHLRRGLVIMLPPGEPPGEVAPWLLRAGELLSTVALTGEWRAEVHLRVRRRLAFSPGLF